MMSSNKVMGQQEKNSGIVNKRSTSVNRQKGMVLVLVLTIFAIAAMVAGELSYQSHREVRRTANILHLDEAYLFAKGGESFAVQKLLMDIAYDKQSGLNADYLTEAWAIETEPYELDKYSDDANSLDTGEFVSESFMEEGEQSAFQDIGEMTIIIEDLQARFNVNNVQYRVQGHLSGEDQFENVLNAVLSSGVQVAQDPSSFNSELSLEEQYEEMMENQQSIYLEIPPADVALALKDWIDLDSESKLATGSESSFYEQLEPPYRAANQAILNITELKAINGFSQNDFQIYKILMPERFPYENLESSNNSVSETEEASKDTFEQDDEYISQGQGYAQYDEYGNLIPIQPGAEVYWGGIKHYLSALPFPSKINVNTAPSQVLQALFSADHAEKIISGRQGSPYQQVDDIFLNLTEIKGEQQDAYRQYLSVSSEYFLATIIAKIEDTQVTLQSTLYKDRAGRVRVIARDFSG